MLLLAALPLLAAPQQRPHHSSADQPQVLAPGYSALQFAAPIPGSYALPSLGSAADGALLDSNGSPASLHSLFDNKTVILSFVYTSCPDVNGCPLATFVLSTVQGRLSSKPGLTDKVRLVTVSFDPFNDSPDIMAGYGKSYQREDVDWYFLTAASESELVPILDEYDQSVIRDFGPDGEPIGTMSHILRVYLIDTDKNIRNIYSPSFLHPDILLADILTIMAGDASKSGDQH